MISEALLMSTWLRCALSSAQETATLAVGRRCVFLEDSRALVFGLERHELDFVVGGEQVVLEFKRSN